MESQFIKCKSTVAWHLIASVTQWWQFSDSFSDRTSLRPASRLSNDEGYPQTIACSNKRTFHENWLLMTNADNYRVDQSKRLRYY